MLLNRLPGGLENAEALIARRAKAAQTKELWRPLYQQCYQFAMPARENFSWSTEGQQKNRDLYDSTLQDSTDTAANTLTAQLFPPWTRWAELGPGGAIPEEALTSEIIDGFQKATKTFFDFLNDSNFSTVISEVALDLMVGTGGLSFDEGDTNDKPFKFSAIPLAAIEIEEGPDGTVENTYMLRKPQARHLTRMYPGLTVFDLSDKTAELLKDEAKAGTPVEVIQCEVYSPENGHYYGIVIEVAEKQIIWRYDYGKSCPKIIARATKTAGETYGRGRVTRALPDAKTLDKMVEFSLRHAALQIAPPMTGVSDGVLNPYTASLTPSTIIPVASNDNGSPSLRPLDIGGNFSIGEALMDQKRQSVRRILLGPEPTEGAVRSATEVDINDRNRLWAMGGEYNRIQAELLSKIIARGVFILQKKGLVAKFKVDGREAVVKYTSPFAKSQATEDVMNLQEALVVCSAAGPEMLPMTVKVEKIPEYVFRLKGVPEKLLRDETEQKDLGDKIAQIMAAQQQQEQVAAQGGVEAPEAGQ
jgi:outer membrane lipopolysaccharide assembly protein LptE/RlpB